MWGIRSGTSERSLKGLKSLGTTLSVRASVLVVGLLVVSTVGGVGTVAAQECGQSGGDAVHLDTAVLSVGDDGTNQVDVGVASDDCTKNDNDDVDVDVLSRESTGTNDNDRLEVAVLANQDSGKHDRDGQDLEVSRTSLPGMYTIYGFKIPL